MSSSKQTSPDRRRCFFTSNGWDNITCQWGDAGGCARGRAGAEGAVRRLERTEAAPGDRTIAGAAPRPAPGRTASRRWATPHGRSPWRAPASCRRAAGALRRSCKAPSLPCGSLSKAAWQRRNPPRPTATPKPNNNSNIINYLINSKILRKNKCKSINIFI